MPIKQPEIKFIYLLCLGLLVVFVGIPMVVLLKSSVVVDQTHLGLSNFRDILTQARFVQAFTNSLLVSIASATVATFLAFIVAYTVNRTLISARKKRTLHILVQFPMLLPTITYGFVIIYTFGKNGLLTKIIGYQVFSELYGFKGLLLGYVVYTLPICYLLLNNTFKYLDQKFDVVSLIMKDSSFRRFKMTLIWPLLGTFAAAIIQSFFLSFTDYGIPASVGGRFEVVATLLYQQMLGVNPSFEKGAVIALFMLLPSIVSIALLQYLARFNVRYDKVSQISIDRGFLHDTVMSLFSFVIVLSILAMFLVLVVTPSVVSWPYDLTLNFNKLTKVLQSSEMSYVYQNSLWMALLTALFGTLICFLGALVNSRSHLPAWCKSLLQAMAVVTNTIPGMVLGIAYLLFFAETPLHNTLSIMVLCNIMHFFSTPYLMARDALLKMNKNWENSAAIMGDTWFQTLRRIIIPNSKSTLLQIFSYLFINAMVTVSAVVFISSAHTMVMTTKINELKHFAKFDEIFILSTFILLTNLGVLALMQLISHLKFTEFGIFQSIRRKLLCLRNLKPTY